MKTSIFFTNLTFPTMILLGLVALVTAAKAAPEEFANEVFKGSPAAYWRLNENRLDELVRDSLCEADLPQHITMLPDLEQACRAGETENHGTYFFSNDPAFGPGIMLGVPGIGGGDTGALFNGTSGNRIFVRAFPRFGIRGVSTLSPGLITMEAVIRWDGPTPSAKGAFQRIIEKSAFPEQAIYGLSIHNENGNVRVELTTGFRWPPTAPGPRTLISDTELKQGQEAHLVATYDGRIIKLFIDGRLDKEGCAQNQQEQQECETAEALVAGPFGGVGIGNQVEGEVQVDITQTRERPFKGLLDEVVLYDQVLSPGCIFAHWEALRGPVTNPEACLPEF